MRVLLDNNVNYRFGALLTGHEVMHVHDLGWERLRNGDLLAIAESERFDVMITGDKQMQYQQNIAGRKISIIILNALFLKWDYIAPLARPVNLSLAHLEAGSFTVITPYED